MSLTALGGERLFGAAPVRFDPGVDFGLDEEQRAARLVVRDAAGRDPLIDGAWPLPEQGRDLFDGEKLCVRIVSQIQNRRKVDAPVRFYHPSRESPRYLE